MALVAEKKERKNAEIHYLIQNWIEWLRTRKFYAAPLPLNILVQLMKESNKRSGEPPDAALNALCAAWNLVIQNAKDMENESFVCFVYVYLPGFRPEPVKTLAARINVDSDTVYQRAHNAAIKYYNQAIKLQELNASMQREVHGFSEGFVD